jgi:dienelactone hydrolase
MSLHSAACCTVPPVEAKDYKTKGQYIDLNGLKTYHTGNAAAKHGILVIYDVFGYFPQTLQGADILAYGDHEQPYQVFMPDFFQGSPADISWYPPDNDEKGKKLGAFFANEAAPPKTLERIPGLVDAIRGSHGVQTLGIVGYCWGGKIVNLAATEGTRFKAAAACHPAMVDPKDAPNVAIPIAVLPSMDEDKTAIKKYEEGLKVKHVVEWFPDQVHGWMAARSNLEDEKVKSEYERGYKLLLDWFHENM